MNKCRICGEGYPDIVILKNGERRDGWSKLKEHFAKRHYKEHTELQHNLRRFDVEHMYEIQALTKNRMKIEIEIAEYSGQSKIIVDGTIKLTYKEWNKERWRAIDNMWNNLGHVLDRLHVEDIRNKE